AGEVAVLDNEGTAVEGNVFDDGRGRPGAVIDENDGAAVDVELGVVPVAGGGAAAGIEIDVSQAALDGGVDEVEAAPIAGHSRVFADVNAIGLVAQGKDSAGAVDRDGGAGRDVNARTGLHRQRDAARDDEVGGDVVRRAGGRPHQVDAERAGG